MMKEAVQISQGEERGMLVAAGVAPRVVAVFGWMVWGSVLSRRSFCYADQRHYQRRGPLQDVERGQINV